MNTTISERRGIPRSVILLITLLCGGMLFLKNGIYLFCCMIALVLMFLLLWRNNRPGILLFAFLMQWAQVISYVVWMNVRGVDINFLSPHANIAVIMSCLGLLVMAMVVSKGIGGLSVLSRKKLIEEASKINERKMLFLYLGSTLFLSSIGFVLGATSGITQVLITLSSLKWIFFLVYGFVAWLNRKNRIILALMVVYEFVTSLYSYFSSFKQVFLIVIILAITFITTITVRQLIYAMLVIIFLGFMGITWSAIKSDYREYVSQGQKQQVVTVSREEALGKLGEQISSLDSRRYQFAMVMTLYRLQYVYHLARTMDRVPAVLPHENGKLWIDNLGFILLPRILFPNKPIFDATQKTNKYTGLNYGGYSKGTSFGIGYFADCYIDFGYVGMFIPLIMIALFVVFIYRAYYQLTSLNMLFRYALINVGLFNFTSFESDGIIVIGRLLVTFLVFWIIGRTVFPRMQRWLYKK